MGRLKGLRGVSPALRDLAEQYLPMIEQARREDAEYLEEATDSEDNETAEGRAHRPAPAPAPAAAGAAAASGTMVEHGDSGTMVQRDESESSPVKSFRDGTSSTHDVARTFRTIRYRNGTTIVNGTLVRHDASGGNGAGGGSGGGAKGLIVAGPHRGRGKGEEEDSDDGGTMVVRNRGGKSPRGGAAAGAGAKGNDHAERSIYNIVRVSFFFPLRT